MITAITLALAAQTAAIPPANNCIGRTVDECIAAFSTQFIVDQTRLAETRKSVTQTYVDGKLINDPHRLPIFFGPKGSVNQIESADIITGPNGRVRRVSADLSPMMKYAKTKEDYDNTDLLQMMSVFFPASCWKNEPLNLYIWYERQIQRKTRTGVTELEINPEYAGDSRLDTSPVGTFCGSPVKVTAVSGHDTSLITEGDTSGYYGGVSITIGR